DAAMKATARAESRTRRWMKGRALLAGLVVVGALLAHAGPASAQLFTRQADNQFRSSRNFALELRFGPYSPDIDDEFGGSARPHEKFFGAGRRLMTQIELDYQVFTRFGSAGVGLSVGYFKEKAKAFLSETVNSTNPTPSGDDTQLSLYPVALLAVYRADQLWQYLGVPLVPYGKIGLNYTGWSIYDGNDQVAEGGAAGFPGRGRGGTRGWQWSAGLALALDIIDRGSARELDSETGVNHTYLFAEWADYNVSGLGQDKRLNVGDSTWVLGLTFEF
ncbi:MAG TPA: MXAN_2562 family outer membrane beta-barrel protein, partial [Polyangia bacterium]